MLIIDPMYNSYLGTAMYIFNGIWLKRGLITKTSIEKINERIMSLVVPPEVRFGRLPACMEHSSLLTAEQWMLWVNYYSLYCLYQIIPHEYLVCWRHFVLASRLLCKRQLSKDEIKVADSLLLQFCRRFELLYGHEAVTPNIHLHAHLTDYIEDYGPMSTFWLYSFEHFNGVLGDEPTNNRSIELTRFLKDNSHLHLLSSIPSSTSDITSILSRVVLDHACSFASTRYLDTASHSCTTDIEDFIPATISSFSELDMEVLSRVYHKIFLLIFYQCQKVKSGQVQTLTLMLLSGAG